LKYYEKVLEVTQQHHALVDKVYGLKPTATDSDRVALLFKLYAEKTKRAWHNDSSQTDGVNK